MPQENLWNDDWMKLQRQYWDQWTRIQQQALGIEAPAASPWQQAMDHWWNAVSTAMPEPGREFLEKIMDQGKHFFRMAEEFSRPLGGNDAAGWKQVLENLAASFTRTTNAAGDGTHQATGFWEMPLDNWNRMASALSPVPGDMLRGMHTAGVKENLDRILGAPGLGYTRESQEQYQSLSQSLLVYQEALAEYSLFFTRMGEGAVLRLSELVQDKPVESARELYDAWIRCCEEEYAAQVITPEYAQLHGRLVNALMQLKNRWGELLDETLSAMNMPTRDDLRALQRRVQEHRREIRTLSTELANMRKRLDNQSPAAPRARPKTAAPASVAKKKTPVRKKSATRKKAPAKRQA